MKVEIPLTAITLNKTSLALEKGGSETLLITKTPDDTTNTANVVWTSSNPAVATVSNKGLVKAVGSGSATITAKVGNISAVCSVSVTAKMTGIAINKNQTSLVKGEEETLKISFLPKDTTDDKSVVWSSSDASVASVSNGKVKALKAGTTTITAKCGSFSVECKVTVTELPTPSVTEKKENKPTGEALGDNGMNLIIFVIVFLASSGLLVIAWRKRELFLPRYN